MEKRSSKKQSLILMCLLSCLIFASCGEDNDNPNNPGGEQAELYFGIKAATIVYSTTNIPEFTGEVKVSFDDYGKKFRCEMGKEIYIIDEDVKSSYTLMTETKTYREDTIDIDNTTYILFRLAFMYSTSWQNYLNFKKEANQMILGKNCDFYTWTDNTADIIWGNVTWGGWNRVTFMWSITTINGITEKYEAKTFTESVNANDFIVPADYTKTN